MNASVILCTCNSAQRMPNTLAALLAQVTPPGFTWEVLLADYKSQDGTIDIAMRLWTRGDVQLHIVPIAQAGKSAALEKALDQAKGTALAIIDDDIAIDPDFLSLASQTLNDNPDVGVIGTLGRLGFVGDLPSWFEKYQDIFAVGPQAEQSGYLSGKRDWVWGAGSVLNGNAWQKLRRAGFRFQLNFSRPDGLSFTSGTGGEDVELCLAVQLHGYRIWYEATMGYQHNIPARRLTVDYLTATTFASSKALPVHDIYRAQLRGHTKTLRDIFMGRSYLSLLYYLLGGCRALTKAWLLGYSQTDKSFLIKNYLGIIEGYRAFAPGYESIKKEICLLSRC